MVCIVAQGTTSGLDSHSSFQASGEIISDREDSVYHFLHFFTHFNLSVFYCKAEQIEIFFTLFLD
jgi:hypothetical protein